MSKCKAVLDGEKITEVRVKAKTVKKAGRVESKESTNSKIKPADLSR